MLKTISQKLRLVVGSHPASVRGVHDGPTRVSLSLDCVKLDPVNQNTQTLMSCSPQEAIARCGTGKTRSHLNAGLMPMLSCCGRAGVRLLRQEDGGGKSFWYWDCISVVPCSFFTAVDCVWSWLPSCSSSPGSLPLLLLFPLPVCFGDVGWGQGDSCWVFWSPEGQSSTC